MAASIGGGSVVAAHGEGENSRQLVPCLRAKLTARAPAELA